MTEQMDFGYIEAAQRLVKLTGRVWTQHELLGAAEAAKLRNTGWPVGLVIRRAGLAPVPTPEGIEARLGYSSKTNWQDYWAFHKEGTYYVVRLFEEDFESPGFTSSEGHPLRSIWFDTRIWRIAEVILHSASLYRALEIPPEEPYLLTINHGGLAEREFYTSTAGISVGRFVWRGSFCHVPTVSWAKELTQDYIVSNLKSLVAEVAEGLFVLFDFAQVNRPVVDEIVDKFLHSRI